MPKKKKVLLIGWDAADWKVITPLLDAGKMPALEGMINAGVMGNLATIRPVLSPMLWTSIATGKRAYKHGILGFTEPTPDGTGIQPITNLSRKNKAFWNVFNQCGMQGHVVGWWPSHPAEPIDGAMVSNRYQIASSFDGTKPWPLIPGTVHPKSLEKPLREARFHPSELHEDQVRPFVPFAGEIDQEQDSRLGVCAKMLAECTSTHGAITWLLANDPWDYAAVYYDAIDHFCHGFMRYHPPQQPSVSDRDFRLYSGVIEAAYRYHDMMLASLLQLAGPETTVMLISDHGFHPDHLRVQTMPSEPAAPASEHRDFGIFVMSGPGVRRDERLYGASLLDVCPTLLTAAGLPTGSDMDGKPLVEAWEQTPTIEHINSWEEVQGNTGQHPEGSRLDPTESQLAIEQLVALGYIEKPSGNAEETISKTVRELRYNLALSYMDADLHSDAVAILEELASNDPDETRFGIRLALCYRALDEIDRLKPLVAKLKSQRVAYTQRSAEQLVEFLQKVEDREPAEEENASDGEGALTALGQAGLDASKLSEQQRRYYRLFDKASKAEREQIRHLHKESRHAPYSFDYLDGYVHAAEGRYGDAIDCFRLAERAEPDRPWLPIQIGEAYLQLRQWQDAKRAFERAAKADEENPYALAGLARAHLGLRNNRLAIDTALSSVSLLYHFPLAHYLLGVALQRTGNYERSKQAFEVALSMNPNYAEAHRRLSTLYRRFLNDSDMADQHNRTARELVSSGRRARLEPSPVSAAVAADSESQPVEDLSALIPERLALHPSIDPANFVTIVTGLPRSGTSMMMQMLQAGGIPLVADDHRTPDGNNPRGYFEHEQAKKLRDNKDWLKDTTGSAVKIIAQLLQYLPVQKYRFIYMNRDLAEVLRSQQKMLAASGSDTPGANESVLQRAFTQQIRDVGKMLVRSKSAVLVVNHRECVERPDVIAANLNRFLGGRLDEQAMSAVVDPALHRQRKDG